MEGKPHLYIIPVAHTYADMGSMRDKVPFDERYETAVTKYWEEIFRYLNSFSPELLSTLQIYQDSLVNAPQEIVDKIVDETQTPNYEILRWLKSKGATIFGTEDISLLLDECTLLQTIANCPNGEIKTSARLEYLKKSSWLLEERDKHIARRIVETLSEGKTGLLFIGAAHDVGSFLNNEIRVSTPETLGRALPEVLQASYSLGRERK